MTSYRNKKETAIYSYIGGWSSLANSKAIWIPTNLSGNTWISSSMGTSQPGTGIGTATSFSSTSNSSPELLPTSHWKQRGYYPGGKLRVF